MPYIIAIQTKLHGLESFVISESLQKVPYSCLMKIHKPHLPPVSLLIVQARLIELKNEGI